jgi:hypothetical protein
MKLCYADSGAGVSKQIERDPLIYPLETVIQHQRVKDTTEGSKYR